jgi:capsular polysaccharide export protein
VTPTLLLRAPPFPYGDASVSVPALAQPLPEGEAEALFVRMREARVGGAFWARPLDRPIQAGIVVRPRGKAELADLLARFDPGRRQSMLWIGNGNKALDRALDVLTRREGGVFQAEVDPWSALDSAVELAAHGDDEWVVIAAIAGVPVRVLSPGAFGSPGEDAATLLMHAAKAIGAACYRDPFRGTVTTPSATIDLLAEWRRVLEGNRGIVAACGMAWWKRKEIRQFLWAPGQKLKLVLCARRALAIARKQNGSVAIWPSRISAGLLTRACKANVPLVRVEDGFVRSVGLGSNLVPPLSVVVDRRGIHFDPSAPSDLEAILATSEFTPELLERARTLRETIVAAGISKYAAGSVDALPPRAPGRRVVLVPGQVEDDMSVLAGGGGLHSNLELLRCARALEPDAEIWWRPHPDVDAGHRVGSVADAEALQYADRIVRGGGMAPLLGAVDAVHVLTSLTGFEALMRGRSVMCHGTPFYAGWGLTRDLGAVPPRRGRSLSLDALVAGVLLLYPRYLDPITGLPCPPEVLVDRMVHKHVPNRQGWIEPLRRLQGRFMAAMR